MRATKQSMDWNATCERRDSTGDFFIPIIVINLYHCHHYHYHFQSLKLLVRGGIPLVTVSSQAAQSGRPEKPCHGQKDPNQLCNYADLLFLHCESLLEPLRQAGQAGQHLNLVSLICWCWFGDNNFETWPEGGIYESHIYKNWHWRWWWFACNFENGPGGGIYKIEPQLQTLRR